MSITVFAGNVADVPIPVWMSMVFGPGILWILFAAFLCSFICWRFIFSNASDDVPKHDRRVSIFKTFLTIFLTNVLSSVLLPLPLDPIRAITSPLPACAPMPSNITFSDFPLWKPSDKFFISSNIFSITPYFSVLSPILQVFQAML